MAIVIRNMEKHIYMQDTIIKYKTYKKYVINILEFQINILGKLQKKFRFSSRYKKFSSLKIAIERQGCGKNGV